MCPEFLLFFNALLSYSLCSAFSCLGSMRPAFIFLFPSVCGCMLLAQCSLCYLAVPLAYILLTC
uniref:Uncharacterized protein n=1 Tax=Arundo donax TaxID=35708 RepID=A0A0A9E6N1_ARUDO